MEELYKKVKEYLLKHEVSFICENANWRHIDYMNIPLNTELLFKDSNDDVFISTYLKKETQPGINQFVFSNKKMKNIADLYLWISLEDLQEVVEKRLTLEWSLRYGDI